MTQRILSGFLVLALVFFSGVSRADVSQVPLFITAEGVDPNVMLMMDSSGSMNNIVPDAPYNPNTVYLATCPSANRIAAGSSVTLSISSGAPRINSSYVYGTTSGRRCFLTNSSYTASLNSGASGYLPSEYTGNYLNWYFNTATDPTGCSNNWLSGRKPCSKSRIMIAKVASTNLVDSLDTNTVRIGFSIYNGNNGGQLKEVINTLDAAKKTAVKTAINAVTAGGNTPLAETLNDIGFYFSRGATNLKLHPETNPSTVSRINIFNGGYTRSSSWNNGVNPVQYYCQKSFSVLLTDGRPQEDQSISSYFSDYDGDCTGASPACLTFDRKSGREYESSGSDYLDDVAQALYEMDLRPDLVPPSPATKDTKNNVATYLISFADKQAMEDPLMPEVAAQGGGELYIAGNEAELVSAFQAAAASIVKKAESSASAIATNSTRLETGTAVYQARFNSADWSGQVIAYEVNEDSGLINKDNPLWNTDTAGLIPAPASRKIYILDGGLKEEFLWTNLDPATDQATLGTQDVLNWIRGDRSKEEGQPSGTLRKRTKILGDIVNSTPYLLGAPPSTGYATNPDGTPNDGYTTFYAANKDRTKMLYVGSNDGMLHAFDASNGQEKFAFIPKTVFPNLASLASPNYTIDRNNHKFLVDGSPRVFDAYLPSRGGWRSILIGTTGAGGKAVFALDVTDRDAFDQNDILWEYTHTELGYTIGQPTVGRIGSTWAVAFGNGYQSTSGCASLFVLNLENGTPFVAGQPNIATGACGSNGLAAPALRFDTNKNAVAAYAGDLQGNVWKFDFPSSTVAFSGNPMFQARDGSGVVQPITAPLEITEYPTNSDKYLVFFGTGKYFETGDHNANPSPVQSLYGIWDNNGPTITGRSKLQYQTISEQAKAGNNFRALSKNPVTLSDTQRGWYVDLVVNSSPVGERVVDKAILNLGRAVFVSRILYESEDPCAVSTGTSWVMVVDMVTGGRMVDPDTDADIPLFDINRDGQFDQYDVVTVPGGGSGSASGFQAALAGISSGVTLIQTQSGSFDLLLSGSTTLTTTASATGAASGTDSIAKARAIAASNVAAAARSVAEAVAQAIAAGGDVAAAAAAAAAAAGLDATAIASAAASGGAAAAAAAAAQAAADVAAARTIAGGGSAADAAAARVAAQAVATAASGGDISAALIAAAQLQGIDMVGVRLAGVPAPIPPVVVPPTGRSQSWRQVQ